MLPSLRILLVAVITFLLSLLAGGYVRLPAQDVSVQRSINPQERAYEEAPLTKLVALEPAAE